MKQYHRACLVLIAAFITLARPAQAAKLVVGVPGWLAPVVREAAARFVEDTGNQVVVHTYPGSAAAEFAARGGLDVLISAGQGTFDGLAAKGCIVAATAQPLVCRRVSVIVAPANPKRIGGLEDLATPGLRWGVVNLDAAAQAQLLGPGEHVFASTSPDPAVMAEWLAAGRVEAVLGWDGDFATRPLNPVIIRLPVSRYGAAAAQARAAVATTTQAPAEAADLVKFLSTNRRATDVYAAHGFLSDDGAGAVHFEDISANRFATAGVYESLARQVAEDYHVTEGVALDLGCGPGRLALTLAQRTRLHVIGVDIEPEAIELARQHAQEAGLAARTEFLCADAHSLPLPDASVDLVVSRATIQFLRDQSLALHEIHRVLRPGGVALIGNGYGRYLSAEQEQKMQVGWKSPKAVEKETGQSVFPFWPKSLEAVMTRTGIDSYRIVHDGGDWIELRKPAA